MDCRAVQQSLGGSTTAQIIKEGSEAQPVCAQFKLSFLGRPEVRREGIRIALESRRALHHLRKKLPGLVQAGDGKPLAP